jgi:ribosomal protein L5
MAQAAAVTAKYTARLKASYTKEYAGQLKADLKLKNINEVPKLEKIVINAGLGRAKDDKSDQSVFPELSYEDTAAAHGLQVIFVIKSNSPEHSRALLEKFGMPFERSN